MDEGSDFCLVRECEPLHWMDFVREFNRVWWEEIDKERERRLLAQPALRASTGGSTT